MPDPEITGAAEITLTGSEIDDLLRKLELIDKQAQNAYAGGFVNAQALFTLVDGVLDLLAAADTTGRFTERRDRLEGMRRREAALRLTQPSAAH